MICLQLLRQSGFVARAFVGPIASTPPKYYGLATMVKGGEVRMPDEQLWEE